VDVANITVGRYNGGVICELFGAEIVVSIIIQPVPGNLPPQQFLAPEMSCELRPSGYVFDVSADRRRRRL